MKSHQIICLLLITLAVTCVGTFFVNANETNSEGLQELLIQQEGVQVFVKDFKLGYRNTEGSKFTQIQRPGNYMFENEGIRFDTFVRDSTGAGNINEVYVTLGDSPLISNNPEVLCIHRSAKKANLNKNIRFDPATDRWYSCEFTAETPEGQYGEYYIGAEANTSSGLFLASNLNVYYFINPVIVITLDGEIKLENLTAGQEYTSSTFRLGNDGDQGSGVPLEFYIGATNLYDRTPGKTFCPSSNVFSLNNIEYQAEFGGTKTKWQKIPYYNSFIPISKLQPIFKDMGVPIGAEISLNFRFKIPQECRGNFNGGKIFLFGRVKDSSPYVPQVGAGIEPTIVVE